MNLTGWILVFAIKIGFTHEPKMIDGFQSKEACIDAAHHLDNEIYLAACIPSGSVAIEKK